MKPFQKLKREVRMKRLDGTNKGEEIELTSFPSKKRSDGSTSFQIPSSILLNDNNYDDDDDDDDVIEDARNATRIASLNGVWSVEVYVRTDVGGYYIKGWYIMNLLCDPTVQNECMLEDCDMRRNKICSRVGSETNYTYQCQDMQYNVIEWSDGIMLSNLGYEYSVPGYEDYKWSGEDFIGDYSVVMAQQNLTEYNMNHQPQDGTTFVDVYSARYTNSTYVHKIFKQKDNDLFNDDDFSTMAGREAVNWTIHYQTFPEDVDIYEPYYNTCENGDAHPTLPLWTFEFNRENRAPFTEMIDIILKYRLFVNPSNTDTWETAKDLGLPVSGPYCYNGELRGYTIDMDFDSKDDGGFIQYEHACIDGDPCLSKAYEKCSLCTEIEVRESSGGTTIQVGILIWLILSITGVALFFLISLVNNVKNRRRIRQLEVELGTLGTEMSMREDAETYALMNNDEARDITTTSDPLLYRNADRVDGDDVSLNSNASHPLSFRARNRRRTSNSPVEVL